jgi:hypothetical protein
MGGDGFVDPGTDGNGMTTACLTLDVGIVGMDQTQDKEGMDQQIETERRYRHEPERLKSVGWSMQERHG